MIFGILLILFGIIVISMPEIIAYMIGGMIIVIGINIVAFSYRLQNMSNRESSSGFSFGGYEIIRKKK